MRGYTQYQLRVITARALAGTRMADDRLSCHVIASRQASQEAIAVITLLRCRRYAIDARARHIISRAIRYAIRILRARRHADYHGRPLTRERARDIFGACQDNATFRPFHSKATRLLSRSAESRHIGRNAEYLLRQDAPRRDDDAYTRVAIRGWRMLRRQQGALSFRYYKISPRKMPTIAADITADAS